MSNTQLIIANVPLRKSVLINWNTLSVLFLKGIHQFLSNVFIATNIFVISSQVQPSPQNAICHKYSLVFLFLCFTVAFLEKKKNITYRSILLDFSTSIWNRCPLIKNVVRVRGVCTNSSYFENSCERVKRGIINK